MSASANQRCSRGEYKVQKKGVGGMEGVRERRRGAGEGEGPVRRGEMWSV